MTDDDRRMVLMTWDALRQCFEAPRVSFPMFPVTDGMSEERLNDLDKRRVVNLIAYWSGGMVHLEPTPEAVAQMQREGYLDDKRKRTAKGGALMKGWSP